MLIILFDIERKMVKKGKTLYYVTKNTNTAVQPKILIKVDCTLWKMIYANRDRQFLLIFLFVTSSR